MNNRERPPRSPGYWREGVFLPQSTFAGLEPPYSDFQRARAVVLPVPYDSTSEWRAGSRHAPQAIIDASQYLELYDLELDRDIYEIGIATLPQVEPVLSGPQDMIARVYLIVKDLIATEKFVVLLGGEHSLSLGAVQAFKEKYPALCVLHLDAHADLRDQYMGTKYGQASVMRRIFELCPICQVGIRSLSREEKQFLAENKLKPLYMSELASQPGSINRVLEALSNEVYVSIDVDVLDPSIMPAVGTPEPEGMSWQQILSILKAVALRKRVVGFDLVEFCPAEGSASCAYLLAKLAYKFMGYAISQ